MKHYTGTAMAPPGSHCACHPHPVSSQAWARWAESVSAQGFPRGDPELLQEAGDTLCPFPPLCQWEGWNLAKPIPPGKPTGDGHRSVGPLFHAVYLQKVDRLWSPGVPFVPCRKVSATSGFWLSLTMRKKCKTKDITWLDWLFLQLEFPNHCE